jgi:hypothetical protein
MYEDLKSNHRIADSNPIQDMDIMLSYAACNSRSLALVTVRILIRSVVESIKIVMGLQRHNSKPLSLLSNNVSSGDDKYG